MTVLDEVLLNLSGGLWAFSVVEQEFQWGYPNEYSMGELRRQERRRSVHWVAETVEICLEASCCYSIAYSCLTFSGFSFSS